nr:alginate export family protein [uncultured Pseudomonas sp.]
MYTSKRIPCVLLALGIPLASQPALAGYQFEEGNLKGELNLTFGAASVSTRGVNFGAGVADARNGEDKGTKINWQEAYLKPGITLDYSLNETVSLLAGASAVGAWTLGDGDAGGTTRSSDNRINTEEAYVGIRAGDWKLTAGRQNYIIGTGFIVMDGNLDLFGDGAYWLGPRTAFKDSAILDWSHGPLKAQAFTLRTDDHYGDYRMTGANLDYDLDGQVTLGAMAMKVDTEASKSSNAVRRDGMEVFNVRALRGHLPGLPNLTLNGEYAVQRGGDSTLKFNADAWYAQADYQFQDLPLTPTLGYRYAVFSGDDNLADNTQKAWDPLSKGFVDWSSWLVGDVVGNYLLFNSNERVQQFSIKNRLTDTLTLGAIHYQFWLDEKNFRGAAVDDRRFADETVVYLDWTPNERFYSSLSYNWVQAKSAAKQAFGDDDQFSALELYFTYRY